MEQITHKAKACDESENAEELTRSSLRPRSFNKQAGRCGSGRPHSSGWNVPLTLPHLYHSRHSGTGTAYCRVAMWCDGGRFLLTVAAPFRLAVPQWSSMTLFLHPASSVSGQLTTLLSAYLHRTEQTNFPHSDKTLWRSPTEVMHYSRIRTRPN